MNQTSENLNNVVVANFCVQIHRIQTLPLSVALGFFGIKVLDRLSVAGEMSNAMGLWAWNSAEMGISFKSNHESVS